MRIKPNSEYDRMLQELLLQQPELKELIFQRIRLFKKNPRDTRLAAHPLTRRMTGKYAFSVTDDIRIVFDVRLLTIGTHPRVYPGYHQKLSQTSLSEKPDTV